MYLLIGTNGRLRAVSPDSAFVPDAGETDLAAELPEGFDQDAPMADWLWEDGAWRYEPLPVPEPSPQLEERMTAVEAAQTAQGSAIDDLVQVMADLIGGAL